MNLTKIILILSISCFGLNTQAQLVDFFKQINFQAELGIQYIEFKDKKADGDGMGWYPYYKIIPQKNSELPASKYIAAKIIYNRHILVYRHTAFISTYNDVPYPETGFKGFGLKTNSFGYGYKILDSKLKVSAFVEACNRSGMEGYIVAQYLNGAIVESQIAFLSYEKPWGFSSSVDVEYLFTKNFGIAQNCGYSLFQFEDSKQSGAAADSNPTLPDTTIPNKKMVIGSLKLVYNFTLPPFKKSK